MIVLKSEVNIREFYFTKALSQEKIQYCCNIDSLILTIRLAYIASPAPS